MEAVGWWIVKRCDDYKPFWSRVEIPTWMQIFFSLIFVRINTNEFIQTNSYNSYTNCRWGGWIVKRCDDCKPFWSRVEIPTWMQIFFSLIFVRIHTNEVIQIIVRIRIRCGFWTNSYNFLYEYCIVRIHTTSWEGRSPSREGEARAHLLPRPGRTRLPRR